jgi:hypothetical protein
MMANRREMASVLAIAGFTLLTAVSGLYLGFVAPRAVPHGKPVPLEPEQGAILYQMHSIYSPGRVRLDWRDVPHATGYRITVMTPADDSLFTSPVLPGNSWVIPHEKAFPLARQTVYHWKVTVLLPDHTEVSEPAAFATQ